MPKRSTSPKKLAERILPYTVDIRVPVFGFKHHKETHDWCRSRCKPGQWTQFGFMVRGTKDNRPYDVIRFYFADNELADKFAETWVDNKMTFKSH